MAIDNSLFYNRDENISGATLYDEYSYIQLTPSYGSSVSFKSKVNEYKTRDYYMNSIPNSMNSLYAEFDLKYQVTEEKAKELAAFIENKNGSNLFVINVDNSGIYKSISGICDNYSIQHLNDGHYDISAKITVDQSPNLFNWSGMSFLNYDFNYWSNPVSYSKYDITYNSTNTNQLNNFYYSLQDHESSNPDTDGPTGNSPKWSQEFFFDPDIGFTTPVSFSNEIISFNNSFPLRMKTQDNNAGLSFRYQYENISTKQLKAMLHFLENKGGYRRFKHQIPSVFDRPKIFYCPEWTHTWKFYDSHDLTVTFVEDVFGVIESDT